MRSTLGSIGLARLHAIGCLAVLVVALALLVPRGARACSCIAPPPPEEAMQSAEAVFEARAFGMSNDDRTARYSFETIRVWKGEISPRVEIVTALHSATCGRSFKIGTKYVIYAGRNKDGQWTDYLCSRTRTSSTAAEDLEVLGPGRPPIDPSIAPPPDPGAEPTEPPRIETPPPEPPPTSPRTRGCAVSTEKPHTMGHLAWAGLLGLGVAIGRRRAVRSRSTAPR